jgi:hypothetical protein
MTTQKTTTTHADLLARFTAAAAQAIREIAKRKKISIAKAILQHDRDATPVAPEVAPEAQLADGPDGLVLAEAQKKSKKSKAAAAPATFTVGEQDPKNVKARNPNAVIKLICKEYTRRPGTDAEKAFQAMADEPTIAAYLCRFDENYRPTARRWLSNHVKSGLVAIEDEPPQS